MVDNVAELAAKAYRVRAAFLERESRSPRLRNMPLTARIIQRYAAIARSAAMAEEWAPKDDGA